MLCTSFGLSNRKEAKHSLTFSCLLSLDLISKDSESWRRAFMLFNVRLHLGLAFGFDVKRESIYFFIAFLAFSGNVACGRVKLLCFKALLN